MPRYQRRLTHAVTVDYRPPDATGSVGLVVVMGQSRTEDFSLRRINLTGVPQIIYLPG